MQAPKMMAMRITRANLDVMAALFPRSVEVVKNSTDICGAYMIINVPDHINTEQYTGIGLSNCLRAPLDFDAQFAFIGKEIPNQFQPIKQLREKLIAQHKTNSGYAISNQSFTPNSTTKTLNAQDSVLTRLGFGFESRWAHYFTF